MAVSKRQRKEKARENDTKENLRTKVRTSGEANSPPGQPSFRRAGSGARDTRIKRGSQDGSRPPLWGWPALTPRGCTFLGLLNKTLSRNQAVTLVRCVSNLCCGKTESRMLHTPPTYLHIIFIITIKYFAEFTNKIVLPVA